MDPQFHMKTSWVNLKVHPTHYHGSTLATTWLIANKLQRRNMVSLHFPFSCAQCRDCHFHARLVASASIDPPAVLFTVSPFGAIPLLERLVMTLTLSGSLQLCRCWNRWLRRISRMMVTWRVSSAWHVTHLLSIVHLTPCSSRRLWLQPMLARKGRRSQHSRVPADSRQGFQ